MKKKHVTKDSQSLAQRVERYNAKPISDGTNINKINAIYLGEPAENAIGVISDDRNHMSLAQSSDLF